MKRFLFFLKMHKVMIIVSLILTTILIWLVWGLSWLDPYTRTYHLAIAPFQMLLFSSHTVLFLFGIYMIHYAGKSFSSMSKKSVGKKELQVKWNDVIGLDDAKQECKEAVELILDRTRIKQIGGRVIKGLLMIGPPGCGKTYLAKAIATATGLPFLTVSGSEFVEMFVGVGASRVRKLFKRAKLLAEGHGGCIVFIDELDAIGRQRTLFNNFGGGQETNTTQNQLLVALDGLEEKGVGNVVVIGATNAPEETLDEALLRPGRFDRKIYVNRPGLEDREKVFEYYLSKIKTTGDIDVGRLARRAVYKTPADISNVVMEAAVIATRKKQATVSYKEISEAFERIELGIKHKITMTKKERRMIAYHEAGHLVTVYFLHPTNDVFKASIIPRRSTLGVVQPQPTEEFHTRSKHQLLADIKTSLGGYISEKLTQGVTSTSVSSDFKMAMRIAHGMVWNLGMGDSGYIGDYSQIPAQELSDDIKTQLNNDTTKIFSICAKDVEKLLTKEKDILERFANELVERSELDYDEIEAIFNEYGKKKEFGEKA